MSAYSGEIAARRTFAIISHPDAGKTTLTEKLLLFGGAGETIEGVSPIICREPAAAVSLAHVERIKPQQKVIIRNPERTVIAVMLA